MSALRAVVTIMLGIGLVLGAVAPAPAQAPDGTAPVIVRRITGPAGEGGWYRGPVNVSWSVSDPESPYTTTGCDARTITADTRGLRVECRAVSAGGVSVDGQVVRIDSTAPTIPRAVPERGPDHSGWYNRPVGVAFPGEDAGSGIADCARETYAGPDAAPARVRGTCRDRAGNTSAPFELALPYDATPPEITGVRPARAPDGGPFYHRAVQLDFDATDATSGVAACPSATFAGPEGAEAQARCTDHAGNEAVRGFAVPFDATPPRVALAAQPGAAQVALRWSAPDAVSATLLRWRAGSGPRSARVIHQGGGTSFLDRGVREGRRYRYAVVVADAAGHTGRAERATRPRRRLLAPADGVRTTAPPLLRWTPVPRTRYYSVKLYHRGRLVLRAWPRRAELQLPAVWRKDGRTRRLSPGSYRWYVWPRTRGRRSFGTRIGTRTFRVSRPAPARPVRPR